MIKEFRFCYYEGHRLIYRFEMCCSNDLLKYYVDYRYGDEIVHKNVRYLDLLETQRFCNLIDCINLNEWLIDYYIKDFHEVADFSWQLCYKKKGKHDQEYHTGKNTYPEEIKKLVDAIATEEPDITKYLNKILK